jgi:hypothetical protein
MAVGRLERKCITSRREIEAGEAEDGIEGRD